MGGMLGSSDARRASLRELFDAGETVLASLPEMVDQARRIAGAIDIPVVADADTGYGNSINVIRTVREYEAAGVAAEG
jgi:2-methylisocitrate lyase-like PEP mutase family enzyme